jgi:hypothetical protein
MLDLKRELGTWAVCLVLLVYHLSALVCARVLDNFVPCWRIIAGEG